MEVPLPGQSRFDRWQTEDIYAALESHLMELTAVMDSYRREPALEEKARVLGVMQIKMDTAAEALGALRRRLEVVNDKRS